MHMLHFYIFYICSRMLCILNMLGLQQSRDCLQGEDQCPRTCKKNRRQNDDRRQKSKHGSFHQTCAAKGAMQRVQLQRTSFWPHGRKFINQRSASAPRLGQSRDSLCNLNTWSLPALRSQTGCNVVDTSAVTNADFNMLHCNSTPFQIGINPSDFRLHIIPFIFQTIRWLQGLGLWRLALTPKSLSPTLEELLTLTLSSSTLTSKSLHKIWKSSFSQEASKVLTVSQE